MNQFLPYDLAYVAPHESPYNTPEIVFIVDKDRLEEIRQRLQKLSCRLSRHTTKYLGDEQAVFRLPEPGDLFGDRYVGFGQCGTWEEKEHELLFRVQLHQFPKTAYCSLTIYMLTMVLNVPEVESLVGERAVELTVVCGTGAYGHAVGGRLASTITGWLKVYAAELFNKPDAGYHVPMQPDVLDALQFTWLAISPDEIKEYDEDVRGMVQKNGAFTLSCFGDRCDLSVYHDSVRPESELDFVELGCHNLDTAVQQLTLLSGLAKLCELAKEGS